MTEAPAPPRVGQGRRPSGRRPWPTLPRWFLAGVGVALAGFAVLAVFAVRAILDAPEQPLLERRSPPDPGRQSHAVGRVVLPDAPMREVSCGVITGLRVQGGDVTGALLEEAVRGMCERLGGVDPRLADRILAAARRRTVISFANFGRTGEMSTTLEGSPPRVLVNDGFIRSAGRFKGYLAPVLAHELWHGASPDVTAEEEYAAREAEAAMCRFIPAPEQFRGCTEARDILELGKERAVAGLRSVGYR